MCTLCDQLIEDIGNRGEYAACPICVAEAKKVKMWLCPRGRPSNTYHADLNEWVIEGVIPENVPGLTGFDHVLPARFIEPWSARGKKGASTEGIYDGYFSSLLVSLHFQDQNDKLYLSDMQNQEVLITNVIFGTCPGTKVLNPFRTKIWEKAKFFNGGLSDILSDIFPESFKLTYEGEFRAKSENFCKLIVDDVKQQENHPRIAKYFGSFWTSNTIRKIVPGFDEYLKKFKEFLSKIKGSAVNNCFMITPPSKKQKVAKSFGFEDTFKQPLGNLSVTPVQQCELPQGDYFGSPKKVARIIAPSDLFGLNGLYLDIFINKKLCFIDNEFQKLVMEKFAAFQSQNNTKESINSRLMKYIMTEHYQVAKFVKEYMTEKTNANAGNFVCSDFSVNFSKTFLKWNNNVGINIHH
jgi:hypothetical protein